MTWYKRLKPRVDDGSSQPIIPEKDTEEQNKPTEENPDGEPPTEEEPTSESPDEPSKEPKSDDANAENAPPAPPQDTLKQFGLVPDSKFVIYTRPDIAADHYITSLTINGPDPFLDCGEYICVVENKCGTNRITHKCNFMTEEEYYAKKYVVIKEREKLRSLDSVESRVLLEKERREKLNPPQKFSEPYKPIVLTEEQIAVRATDIYYRRLVEAKAKRAEEERKRNPPPEPEINIGKDAEFITKPFCVVSHLLNHTVLQGKDIRLSWVVQAFDELQAVWTKNGVLVVNSKRIQSSVTKNGLIALDIKKSDLTDSGKYRCTITSKKHGSITQECSVTVFKIDSTEEPPSFTRPINETYSEHNHEIVLDCHIRGEPKPKIQWLRQGLFLNNDEKHLIRNHEDGTTELIIICPDRWDSGKYQLRIKNIHGKLQTEHILNFKNSIDDFVAEYLQTDVKHKKELEKLRKSKYIKEADWELYGDQYTSRRHKPEKQYDKRYMLKFITKLSDQMVSVGSVLTLKCLVDGSYPQFAWYKEDMPIVHGRKYYMKTKRDGMVELDVRNMTTRDAGTYRLVCRNYANEIETKANVTVFENPYQKIDPPLFVSTLEGNMCCVVLCLIYVLIAHEQFLV